MAISYAERILASGPTCYWRLHEPGGATTAVNLGLAGSRLNGTDYGGKVDATMRRPVGDINAADLIPEAYVTGKGLNTAVNGRSNPFSGEWTIEAWFLRRTVVKWGGIFTNNNPGKGAPLLTFVEFSNRVGLNGSGLTVANVSVDLGDVHFNEPIYAIVIKRGGNARGTAHFEIHASLQGRRLPPVMGTNDEWDLVPQDSWDIGRHNSTKHYFDGQIADVAVYDRALREAEIGAHLETFTQPAVLGPVTSLQQGIQDKVLPNLVAEAGRDQWSNPAGADAEPIPDLEFDQTLGL